MEQPMLDAGNCVDNRTICDLFNVANMGGIRVCRARNHIVLIANNTDRLYRNEWRDGVLHFVGMGSTGPQKLERQNRTLANAIRNGTTLHLFEVFEKSRYVYAGEVELAGEPYRSDQPDAHADDRFVWIFPLRRKPVTNGVEAARAKEASAERNHLPQGAYAVIGSDLSEDQTELVNRLLDDLKLAGISVFDRREVDQRRYDKALARWHEQVLDRARSIVRELIAGRKRAASSQGRSLNLVDDELRINAASNEKELRDALKMLDRDDRVAMNEVFEEARRSVPMPDPPKSLRESSGPVEMPNLRSAGIERADPGRFGDFT
jgi:5-methylcytosine-specific restriction protein A